MRSDANGPVADLLNSACGCSRRVEGRSALVQAHSVLEGVSAAKGPWQAIVVPGGALERSTVVAAKAYGAARASRIRRVVLLGLGEGESVGVPQGPMTAMGSTHVALDQEACALLANYPGFKAMPLNASPDLRAQLPFIAALWPKAGLVPLAIGSAGDEKLARLGGVLKNVLDEDTLVVAVSGWTHFGPLFDGPRMAGAPSEIAGELTRREATAVEALLARDPQSLAARLGRESVNACGRAPLLLLLTALGPGERGQVFGRGSSFDKADAVDSLSGVSYLAAGFEGRYPPVPALCDEDRLALGALAQEAVAAAVQGRPARSVIEPSPRLRQRGGAFVTLEQQGRLRGCMGRLEAPTLAQAISEAGAMAAEGDPRFNPLRPDELPSIEIEISVLSRFHTLESIEEFEPGRHGLLLTSGYHRGLLLPQVATKYAMDRDEFLEALADKAGLAPGGWRDATLQRFGVEAFSPEPMAR